MGMYTELCLKATLKEDTPEEVIKILEYMLSTREEGRPEKLPDHQLFETKRWYYMLNCTCGPSSKFSKTESSMRTVKDKVVLDLLFQVKNHDDEIEHFLDWINPYVDEYMGYILYEEDEEPSNIHYSKGP